MGLIAQNVRDILPEVVHNIEGSEYLGVNYVEMIPLLVEAIRELDERTKSASIDITSSSRQSNNGLIEHITTENSEFNERDGVQRNEKLKFEGGYNTLRREETETIADLSTSAPIDCNDLIDFVKQLKLRVLIVEQTCKLLHEKLLRKEFLP